MRSARILGSIFLSLLLLSGCEERRNPSGPRVGYKAPEIEGTDLDGKYFKLSEYQGKVVFLDFWGEWCSVCRTFYSHGKSLAKRYENRPFALLGVNNDDTLDIANKAVAKNRLTLRSWFEPRGQPTPIARRWVHGGYPTIYLIDSEGIIQHYYGGLPNDLSELDRAVEALVKKAESKG